MNNLGKQLLKWTTMIALSIASTVVLTIAARLTWEVVRFTWQLCDWIISP
ncbi:MAG: hypothetical protein IPG92_15560 [Flavobacteriales bacterium]|jgi:hypothetical protein|nr:hypothetical protein [Flavobacteriales bacterium]